ncbi:hypothetical protein QTG56_18035 [Rossellomorea sp. AcN35-11]|nr:hypothetical protein [Rossellomorea aquimaris]WJV28892.1 hypothetical protein QTG56_18035 [Rossellomorea sp. AcN35-11]
MVTFLLFISFLLNVVSLLSIVILYVRQNRLQSLELEQKKMIGEMEDVISSYVIEMKEENDEFIRNFKKHAESQMTVSELAGDAELPRPVHNHKPSGKAFMHASKAYEQSKMGREGEMSEEMQTAETSEDPVVHKILLLKQEGLTIEEIAHSVGKGKTEIELLLKFRQML